MQVYCDPCWRRRHANKYRAHHVPAVVGADDRKRKVGEVVTFGILTRDIHDNNVVIPETSHTALEIVMEFRELPPDSKRKDAKGKKKPALIPLMIQMPDGASWPMEVLGNEAVVVIKRKVCDHVGQHA